MVASMEERMLTEVNESRMAPVAMAMIPGDGPASYVLSSPVGLTLSSTLTASESAFVRQRTDNLEADRRFLLWGLASLVVATITCGAIAMSAAVMIAPAVN